MKPMFQYNKNIIAHPEFYIATYTRKSDDPYLVFIHGGPGLNCGIIEYLIENDNLFASLNFNIIVYDQRNCGRSVNLTDEVKHQDNINDLEKIYRYLKNITKIKITGFMAHSYGAKLLFDYYKQFNSTIPGIFISTAESILIPRLNNLILDLTYLRKTNLIYYNEILSQIDNLDLIKTWELTEKLAPLFQENKDRHHFYWANLSFYKKTLEAQKKLNLPINNNTFMSVRKDLYSKENNFSVEINTLNIPYLWINGFQDYIMNGTKSLVSTKSTIIPFYQSSHYPHIEENKRFSEIVNEFIKNVRSLNA